MHQCKLFFPQFSDIHQAVNTLTQQITTYCTIPNFQFGLKKSYDWFNHVRESHIFSICEMGLMNALGSNKLINFISSTTMKPMKAAKYLFNTLVFSISSCGTYTIHLTHKELCQHAENLLLKAENIFFMIDDAFQHENQLLKAAGYEDLSITISKGNNTFYHFSQTEFYSTHVDESTTIRENAFFDAILKTLSIADLLPFFMPHRLLMLHLPLTAFVFMGLYFASHQKYTDEFNQAQYLKCLRHKILLTQEKILALQQQFGSHNDDKLMPLPNSAIIFSASQLHRLQKMLLTLLPYLNACASGASMTAGVKKLLETLRLQNPLVKLGSLISTFTGVTLQTYKNAKSDEDFRQLLNQFSVLLSNLERNLNQAKIVLSQEQSYVLHINQPDNETTLYGDESTMPSVNLDENALLKLIETTMEDPNPKRNAHHIEIPISTGEEHDTMRFFSGKKASPSEAEEMTHCKKYL